MKLKETDWDKYYQKPAPQVSITRKISTDKIHRTIENLISPYPKTICELGGANSCFLDSFLAGSRISNYHIVDSNTFGLSLLDEKMSRDKRVSCEQNNVLKLTGSNDRYDLVYSVGLIEHFDITDTAKSIAAHFELCKPGGYVLMTFPTPTWLYCIIRKAAEVLGIWQFHDERPLDFKEVDNECVKHGEAQHQSINWMIGLTQGYVLYKKRSDDLCM